MGVAALGRQTGGLRRETQGEPEAQGGGGVHNGGGVSQQTRWPRRWQRCGAQVQVRAAVAGGLIFCPRLLAKKFSIAAFSEPANGAMVARTRLLALSGNWPKAPKGSTRFRNTDLS